MIHWCISTCDNVESDKNLQIWKGDCLLFLLFCFLSSLVLKLEEEADEVGMNMAAKVQKWNFFFNPF